MRYDDSLSTYGKFDIVVVLSSRFRSDLQTSLSCYGGFWCLDWRLSCQHRATRTRSAWLQAPPGNYIAVVGPGRLLVG